MVFEVTVHYEDEDGYKRKSESLWILADNDQSARKEGIKIAKRDADSFAKLLYCEISLAGTIDGTGV